MKIIEYDSKYDEPIKDLLVELQNYLIDIDNWHTQIMLPNYRKDYFKLDIKTVKEKNGKIYLALDNNAVIGLIMGSISVPDKIDKLTNDCAKTGNILELIVKNSFRGKKVRKSFACKN